MVLTIRSKELFMRILGKTSEPHSLHRGDVEITIDPEAVITASRQKEREPQGKFTKVHRQSGWRIQGFVSSDYYTSCSAFKATHKTWGFVALSNNTVRATSRLGFEAFWYAHGELMGTFDSGDI